LRITLHVNSNSMLYLKSDLNVAECIKFCNAIIYIYNQTHFDKRFILRWCKNTVHWNRSRCTSKAYRMYSRMLFSHPEYCNIANALILNWNENFTDLIIHLIISQMYSGRWNIHRHWASYVWITFSQSVNYPEKYGNHPLIHAHMENNFSQSVN